MHKYGINPYSNFAYPLKDTKKYPLQGYFLLICANVHYLIEHKGILKSLFMQVRRFACVNVHLPGGEPRTIGMIRIKDTLDAERGAELLSKKLEEFDLSVERDIVGTTTDGASGIHWVTKIFF